MIMISLIREHVLAWWTCRHQIERVVTKLRQAGVHRQDPMFPLIQELSVVPDRILRVLIAIMLCSGIVIGSVVGVIAIVSYRSHVTVFSKPQGDLLLIDSPVGTKSVPCPPEYLCLFIPKS